MDETDETCRCDCCNQEIPLSVAISPEGMDYVYHFCSDSCYQKWKMKQQDEAQ